MDSTILPSEKLEVSTLMSWKNSEETFTAKRKMLPLTSLILVRIRPFLIRQEFLQSKTIMECFGRC